MLKPITITTSLALAAMLSQGVHVAAETGPIREGARRTGEAVADGTSAVVRGSREAIGRAGQETRDAVRTTGDAARAQLDRGERSELQVNSGAADLTQGQLNADGQSNGQAYDANGQYRRESGFRGVEDQNLSADPNRNQQGQASQVGQVEYNGRTYPVRHDSRGREYICVGGCPVFLDNQAGNPQSHDAYKMNSDEMKSDSVQHDGAYQGQQNYQRIDAEHNTYIEQGRNDAVPAPPAPVRADAKDVNPAGPTLNTDAEASADPNVNLNRDANLDAEAKTDADNNAASNNDSNSEQGSPSPRDEGE